MFGTVIKNPVHDSGKFPYRKDKKRGKVSVRLLCNLILCILTICKLM